MKSNGFILVMAAVLLLSLCIAVEPASAAAPVAAFIGDPTSDPASLAVGFAVSGE